MFERLTPARQRALRQRMQMLEDAARASLARALLEARPEDRAQLIERTSDSADKP